MTVMRCWYFTVRWWYYYANSSESEVTITKVEQHKSDPNAVSGTRNLELDQTG